MRQRNRQDDNPPRPTEVPDDADAVDRLQSARREGEGILRAVERILSNDSEQFLRANRQQGGQ